MDILNATLGPNAQENATTPSIPTSPGSWLEHVLLPSLFLGACFVVGIPGNILVIWTIVFRISPRSFTVVLLLHMAIADFSVLITLPLWIHALVNSWVFGLFFCKFLTYIIHVSMYGSLFFITLMSVHRFMAVVFPFVLLRWQQRSIVYKILGITWLLALVFASPVFVYRSTLAHGDSVQCSHRVYSSDQQKLAILLIESLVGFVVPFSILLLCYSCILHKIQHLKAKKIRSEKLIASVVITFFLCWFPYHVFNVLIIASVLLKPTNPETSDNLERIIAVGNNIAGALAFFCSCLNPILYAFAGRSFRGGLRGISFVKVLGQMNEDTGQKKSTTISHISYDLHSLEEQNPHSLQNQIPPSMPNSLQN
ncbi:C3a anaphylatoxin chemotactic receptor-like [Rhinatrema bivittatum]|uniref:C3a anaphylatoxin chemotactic receptor-like n=1 Tax=Rhinatrema bivittatum TaxID=194408 RepID=UPI001129D0B8|nr:C3a anaphylatoxin chemotactic receptor-like [Rhinatrema bivittatum]